MVRLDNSESKMCIKLHVHGYCDNDIWVRYSLALIHLNLPSYANECMGYFSDRIIYTENFKLYVEFVKILQKILNGHRLLFTMDTRTNETLYKFTGQRLQTIKTILADFPTILSQSELYEKTDKCMLSHFVKDTTNEQFELDQFWLELYIAHGYIIHNKYIMDM